mgnify:CR=1 FL=1
MENATECMNFILRDEISSLCCWKMANVLPVRLSVLAPVRTISSVWPLRFPISALLFNTVIQYCWEDVVVGYDDDGNEITQKGIYRIPDIELLDEIIAFGPGTNTDRIIAFGHALLLAKYYG